MLYPILGFLFFYVFVLPVIETQLYGLCFKTIPYKNTLKVKSGYWIKFKAGLFSFYPAFMTRRSLRGLKLYTPNKNYEFYLYKLRKKNHRYTEILEADLNTLKQELSKEPGIISIGV